MGNWAQTQADGCIAPDARKSANVFCLLWLRGYGFTERGAGDRILGSGFWVLGYLAWQLNRTCGSHLVAVVSLSLASSFSLLYGKTWGGEWADAIYVGIYTSS